MESLLDSFPARRFVLELLKQTGSGKTASLQAVAAHARCSSDFAFDLLTRLNIGQEDGRVSLSTGRRLDLAMGTARPGSLEAGRYLSWQEFERFAEECLGELGYETMGNVRLVAEDRRWQIDLVGIKSPLVLCFDCKQWRGHSSPSRFRRAGERQVKATRIIASRVGRERKQSIFGLPIILTLFEPPGSPVDDVVVLSIQKLPGLLRDLTQYSDRLPFVLVEDTNRENPIKQAAG